MFQGFFKLGKMFTPFEPRQRQAGMPSHVCELVLLESSRSLTFKDSIPTLANSTCRERSCNVPNAPLRKSELKDINGILPILSHVEQGNDRGVDHR